MDQLINGIGDFELFQRCLEALPDAQSEAIIKGDVRDADGRDILQHAVLQVQIPVIKYLLDDLGSPIDHTDSVNTIMIDHC